MPSFGTEVETKTTFLTCTDDSHLHFEIAPDCCGGQPRFWDRFPLLWSGCRLTHGVLQGRVGFELRVERALSTTRPDDKDDKHPHGLRVGWSASGTSLLLGEEFFPFLAETIWTLLNESFDILSFFLTLDFHLFSTRRR